MHYNLFSDLDSTSQLDTQDRGLHYGDGLFETMLLAEGKIKYWPEHYSRLLASANKLFINCPSKTWFENKLQPFIDLDQRLIVKIILTRGTGGRGLDIQESLQSNIYLYKYDFEIPSINQLVKAIISEITLPVNHNLAGIKHLNRLDYTMAALQLKRREGYNEALMFDTNGNVIESLINNVFFVNEGAVCTPDLGTSGVNGVMRQLVLKKLMETGKAVKISQFNKNDLLNAEECFLCNSVRGIIPVIQIEKTTFPIGQLTTDLQKIFHGHSGN